MNDTANNKGKTDEPTPALIDASVIADYREWVTREISGRVFTKLVGALSAIGGVLGGAGLYVVFSLLESTFGNQIAADVKTEVDALKSELHRDVIVLLSDRTELTNLAIKEALRQIKEEEGYRSQITKEVSAIYASSGDIQRRIVEDAKKVITDPNADNEGIEIFALSQILLLEQNKQEIPSLLQPILVNPEEIGPLFELALSTYAPNTDAPEEGDILRALLQKLSVLLDSYGLSPAMRATYVNLLSQFKQPQHLLEISNFIADQQNEEANDVIYEALATGLTAESLDFLAQLTSNENTAVTQFSWDTISSIPENLEIETAQRHSILTTIINSLTHTISNPGNSGPQKASNTPGAYRKETAAIAKLLRTNDDERDWEEIIERKLTQVATSSGLRNSEFRPSRREHARQRMGRTNQHRRRRPAQCFHGIRRPCAGHIEHRQHLPEPVPGPAEPISKFVRGRAHHGSPPRLTGESQRSDRPLS